MGYRQQVDVHWLRGNSYAYAFGWDWIRRTLIEPKELICDVRFVGHFNTDPVIPSLKYLMDRFQLEFTARTQAYPE